MSSTNDLTENDKSSREQTLRVLELLRTFYGAVGNPPTVEGSLALMATNLSGRASIDEINAALNECSTIEYPVRLPHIVARLPGGKTDVDAEARLAWQLVENFSSKWLRWNDDRTHASIEGGAPDLAPRIADTVRRSGGWSVYLRMTDEDFPHVQKRFFEEYKAWTEIERISDRSRLLETPAPVKQLAAAMKIFPPEPSKKPQHVTPNTARLTKLINSRKRV
jgi:hypothetical protein